GALRRVRSWGRTADRSAGRRSRGGGGLDPRLLVLLPGCVLAFLVRPGRRQPTVLARVEHGLHPLAPALHDAAVLVEVDDHAIADDLVRALVQHGVLGQHHGALALLEHGAATGGRARAVVHAPASNRAPRGRSRSAAHDAAASECTIVCTSRRKRTCCGPTWTSMPSPRRSSWRPRTVTGPDAVMRSRAWS